MIIKIAPVHARPRALAAHLLRTDDGNERIQVVGARGTMAEDVLGSLQEMSAMKHGSRCQKPLYHVAFNAAPGENLTPEQWERALDLWERKMGLEDHQRIVIQHFKDGRFHTHAVWNRIDPETGLAVDIGRDYFKAKEVARAIEKEFGLERVPDTRPEHRRDQQPPLRWEAEQSRRTKTDSREWRDRIAEAWERSDSGRTFVNALQADGLMLARGDRRPYLVVDEIGNFYALSGRSLPDTLMSDIREKLKDLDPEKLPTIEQARDLMEARALAREPRRKKGDGGGGTANLGRGEAPSSQRQVDELHDKYRRMQLELREKASAIEETHARAAAELAKSHERERKALAEKQRDRWWHKIVRKGEKIKEKETRTRAKQQARHAREHESLERRREKALATFEAKREALREREKQEQALRRGFNERTRRPEGGSDEKLRRGADSIKRPDDAPKPKSPGEGKLQWYEDTAAEHERDPKQRPERGPKL